MNTTLTLADFLLARFADDEALIRYEMAGPWYGDERLLAECDVKRRIVEQLTPASINGYTCFDQSPSDVRVLRLLALPYADHPDYDPAWRP